MQRIEVRPGYVIRNTSRASGGVTYHRTRGTEERVGSDGYRQQIETEKTVDHEEAVRRTEAVAKRADAVCRKYCATTTFGWFAPPDVLPDLRLAFDALRDDAIAANEYAESVGSARRVHVGYVLTLLDLSHADAAREVARTVRETLGEILATLRTGQCIGDGAANKARAPIARASGLERLAVGIVGDTIRQALDSIGGIVREIRRAVKAGETPESAGGRVDMGAIETALAWVSEDGIGGSPVEATIDLDSLDS